MDLISPWKADAVSVTRWVIAVKRRVVYLLHSRQRFARGEEREGKRRMGDCLHVTISSLLSRLLWLLGTPLVSPSRASPLGCSPGASTPTPKSDGRRPWRFGMCGSAQTSMSCEMMLRLPILAAMFRAVSPALSCAFTISFMKRARPSLLGLAGWLPFGWVLWLLGALPCRTTHSSRHWR